MPMQTLDMLGVTALVTRRVGSVAIVALAFVLGTSSLTFAKAQFTYGEMVDYQLTFPVDGAVRLSDSFYAARSNGDHHAQDLMAPKMTPVLAAAAGTVRYVNWSRDPGNLNPHRCCTVVIRHDDGWESWYIHLNNDTPGTDDGQAWGMADGIVPGVRVAAGQHIGWVGDSGNAEGTAPHLHFELYTPDGVIVNPYQALLAACGACTTTATAGNTSTSSGGNTTNTNTNTVAGPNDTLVLGSRGPVVAEVQSSLATHGFSPGPADGIFGGKTLAAVLAFQEARGLLVDGKVGPATKAALASEVQPQTSTQQVASPAATSNVGVLVAYGTRGSSVINLQSMLDPLGHDPGGVDGAFGPLTLAAVKRFQRASGLADDGTVGQTTWDALIAAAGSGGETVAPVVVYGTISEKVLKLQSMLDTLGHAPGPVDGIFGPKTNAAVGRFQTAVGFSGGLVDQATWDALVAAAG
jgi:peptidoglycan hydrolase-like protein with peptidoglycan-binding domain